MDKVTILLLVSRDQHIERVFEALNNLDCDRLTTSILCIVNGDMNLFLKTRNLCEMSKFGERLCVQVDSEEHIDHFNILGRRQRIADLHNIAKEHIDTKYVFGVEDDTIIPPDALQKLLYFTKYKNMGFVQGIELGRWGVPYIGSWRTDDVQDPTEIISTPLLEGRQKIDAGGFYCFLTKAKHYKAHDFQTFQGNGLGPDIEYSLSLRQQGLDNYADYDVKCVHLNEDRIISFNNSTPRRIKMYKKDGSWKQAILPLQNVII